MDDLSAALSRQHQPIELKDKGRPARDVAPGECWAFRDHRSMAEVVAAERRPWNGKRYIYALAARSRYGGTATENLPFNRQYTY
jgi:hypothetical protein